MALLNGKQIKDTSVALGKLNGTGIVAITGEMNFTETASLTLAAAPVIGTDATNKDYVDQLVAGYNTTITSVVTSSVSDEATLRAAADASLEVALSIERVRTDAILEGATFSLDTFLEVVNFVNSVDSSNDGALTAAMAGVSNDISSIWTWTVAEASAREALQADVYAADVTLTSSISAEVSNRTAADAALSSTIATVDAALTSSISTEVSNRIAVDATLSSAISAEVSSRIAADASIATVISTISLTSDFKIDNFTGAGSDYTLSQTPSTNDAVITAFVNGLFAPISSVSNSVVTLNTPYTIDSSDSVTIKYIID